MRRANALRISVHHANAVVWEPVCGTRRCATSMSAGTGDMMSVSLRRDWRFAAFTDWPLPMSEEARWGGGGVGRSGRWGRRKLEETPGAVRCQQVCVRQPGWHEWRDLLQGSAVSFTFTAEGTSIVSRPLCACPMQKGDWAKP